MTDNITRGSSFFFCGICYARNRYAGNLYIGLFIFILGYFVVDSSGPSRTAGKNIWFIVDLAADLCSCLRDKGNGTVLLLLLLNETHLSDD